MPVRKHTQPVDEKKVNGHSEYVHGTAVTVDECTALEQGPGATLTFKDINYSVSARKKAPKQILSDVSGYGCFACNVLAHVILIAVHTDACLVVVCLHVRAFLHTLIFYVVCLLLCAFFFGGGVHTHPSSMLRVVCIRVRARIAHIGAPRGGREVALKHTHIHTDNAHMHTHACGHHKPTTHRRHAPTHHNSFAKPGKSTLLDILSDRIRIAYTHTRTHTHTRALLHPPTPLTLYLVAHACTSKHLRKLSAICLRIHTVLPPMHAHSFAKPGEMLALMGASDAGKSTLLDIVPHTVLAKSQTCTHASAHLKWRTRAYPHSHAHLHP